MAHTNLCVAMAGQTFRAEPLSPLPRCLLLPQGAMDTEADVEQDSKRGIVEDPPNGML